MIYTLGHRESYDAALAEREAEGKPLMKVGRGIVKGVKFEGGSVWKTRAEAEAHIQLRADEGRPLVGFAVYGIEAD